MALVYVTGVPGAGKSVVRRELRTRGFAPYGTDEDGVGAFYDLEGDRVEPDQVVNSPEWRAPDRVRVRISGERGRGVAEVLRFGEVAGLRVGRVDFERRTLREEEAIAETSGHIYAKEPKTQQSRRALPISEPLARILKQHFADRGLFGGPADAWVFAAPHGGPLSRTRFRSRVWVPACRRAGLDGVGFHDLRRTNATALVYAGASIRDAQDLLGHKDPRMLLTIYAQATSEGQRDAVDRISSALVEEPDPQH